MVALVCVLVGQSNMSRSTYLPILIGHVYRLLRSVPIILLTLQRKNENLLAFLSSPTLRPKHINTVLFLSPLLYLLRTRAAAPGLAHVVDLTTGPERRLGVACFTNILFKVLPLSLIRPGAPHLNWAHPARPDETGRFGDRKK